MIDALGEALRAVAARSAAAYPLAALAGAASGVGPCTAPRAVALVALVHGSARPARVAATFVGGVLAATLLVGAAAGATAALLAGSRAAYALAAAALALGGIATLARAGSERCAHGDGAAHPTSLGGALLLGASSALLTSPCCMPAILALGGLTLASGRDGDGIALLAAFAFGHALPLLASAFAASRASALLRRVATAQAPALVAGTLMLALACFYGVLA